VSGKNRGWIKVKCHAWRAANRDRGEMFAKGSGQAGRARGQSQRSLFSSEPDNYFGVREKRRSP
jgi:hypothetical protein